MGNNDLESKSTRKSSVKHGMIAMVVLGICILLIVLGIYLFGGEHNSDDIQTDQSYSSESTNQ